jgi:hypothetical protein
MEGPKPHPDRNRGITASQVQIDRLSILEFVFFFSMEE